MNEIKDLELIQKVFDKYNIRLIIVYGALLGWHRDRAFLPGDDDIDLAIIDPVDFKTRKAIGWALYDLGFKPQSIMFNVFGRMEMAEIGYNGDDKSGIIVCEKNIKFTIFFFGQPEKCDKHGEEIVCIPKLGALKLIASPAKFYQKLDKIKIGKQKYLCPSAIKEYLAFTYGDWKDKTLRNHGETYETMHPEYLAMLKEPKNEATIIRSA